MKSTGILLPFIVVRIFCGCSSPDETPLECYSVEANTEDSDSLESTMGSALAGHYDEFEDTTTVIQFAEMTITINRLVVYDEDGDLEGIINGDTVDLFVELSETVEGQQ